MLLISAHIPDCFRKLRLFRQWDKGMAIYPEDETAYTTQYLEAFLKYMENEYCAKHRRFPVITPKYIPNNNLVTSAMASRSGQSSQDSYDLFPNDAEYIMPNNVAETTPRRSDHAASLLTTAWLYLNTPPQLPQNWGLLDPNLNDYHSDPMEMNTSVSNGSHPLERFRVRVGTGTEP